MSKPINDQDFLSRSALAERLSLPLKDLTQMMLDAGWINQKGKQWILTAKGEFEGGQYRQSEKYGQYIVWPKSITEHPVIRDSADDLITVSSLAKAFDLPARLLNRLFYEMGFIEPLAKGWQITALGRENGGQVFTVEETGIPYVKWPRSLKVSKALANRVELLLSKEGTTCLDGRVIEQVNDRQIANWLYLQGFSYSYKRPLFLKDDLSIEPDFYLPFKHVCIHLKQESLKADALVQLLKTTDSEEHFNFKQITIKPHLTLAELDTELTKSLVQAGIAVY